MLKNLQERLCPWTAEQALNQKISANLLAEVYFNIVRPQELSPPEIQLDEGVLQKLGGDVYRTRCSASLRTSARSSALFCGASSMVMPNSGSFWISPAFRRRFAPTGWTGPWSKLPECGRRSRARPVGKKLARAGGFYTRQPHCLASQEHTAPHFTRPGAVPQRADAVRLHCSPASGFLQGASAKALPAGDFAKRAQQD